MSVIELLATLKEKDVQLSVKGDQLVVQGNKQALKEPAVLASLREHKAALIALINAGEYSAQRVGHIDVPANAIAGDCTHIKPSMLPLVSLSQEAIDRIVAQVPGGAANVQDIYPLAALQEGIFYHHVTARDGDPYLMRSQFAIATRTRLDEFAQALQKVIDRHDILRTSIVWEGLDEPVQVVWRQSPMVMDEVVLDPAAGPVTEQLYRHFDTRAMHMHIDQAPLLRLVFTEDAANQRWIAMLLFHHIAMDHIAMQGVYEEVHAFLYDYGDQLGKAVPYRNFVAQARLGMTVQEHEAFFREMLGDLDEPTLPFGHQDVQGDERDVTDLAFVLDDDLSRRLRAQARKQGVSVASLHHLAWAQVLGRISARDDVVFGTVLMGRMAGGEGSDRGLGLFINTLPLRLEVGAVDVHAATRAAHARLTRLLGHEHAPLALAQRCSGVAAPTPLFSALINYRQGQAPVSKEQLAQRWDGIEGLGAEGRSNYPLVLSVDDVGEDFNLTLQGVASMPLPRIQGYLLTALNTLVSALEQGHAPLMHDLPIVPVEEREAVTVGFNQTARDYARGQTIHGLFQARAAELPQAIAVQQGGQQLSYRQLNERANQLARHLLELGIQPDDRVAICARRSLETLVGLVAILKAGAAYVPVDPAHPRERIAYLLQDSAPRAVLAQQSTRPLLGEVGAPVIDLDDQAWQHGSPDNLHLANLTPTNLAYVIYTSGSTGQPKGVMVEHRTLENLVNWHCEAFDLHAGGHTSSVAGFGFDAMAWEVWPALCAGATLHLPPAQQSNEDIDALLQWWIAQPLDVSFLPTPVAEYAFSRGLEHPTLKNLLIGGDRLRQFNTPQRFNLINNYGPTEATVVATSGLIEAGKTLHIGKPIANTQAYLLDAQLQPVPQGVAGELYVGGAGVARGYLNRAQMTAERFIKDPFSTDPGARLYRTGDLARWLEDGTLDYLGRNDDQVKIRGVRIELGEIETCLGEHAQVREAVVLARDGRLVAYFTEQQPVEIEVLRTWLQAHLPEYMVPAAYVRLDSLPLTANGKLDRKALPQPDLDAVLSRGYEAPQGEVEETLARIWADVLKVERVGRQDHFFELGGHSLLAVNLIERMRQVGLGADVRVLFSQPTLAALAAAVGVSHEIVVPSNLIVPGTAHITPDLLPLAQLSQADIDLIVAAVPGGVANVQDIYPLAPLQEGILYLHLSAEHRDPYVLQAQFAFDDIERLLAFCEALQMVVDRHDILRTAVLWEGLAQPLQVVVRQAKMSVEAVKPVSGGAALTEQLQAHVDSRYTRLDLNQTPLMRIVYAQDEASGQAVAFLLFHHLVLDHTALEVVQHEMQAYLLGEADQLGASVPYRNYVAQARLGVSEQQHEAFFREQLADIDEPTLPFGLQDVEDDGEGIDEAHLTLDESVSARLRARARQLGVSPASLFHLAWAQVLGVVARTDQVVFGTVMMGRLQGGDGADRALGMFINTLPLRVNIDGRTVQAAVRATHGQLTGLLAHEHASLALAQRCSGIANPMPLFSALLNYRHNTAPSAAQVAEQQKAWQGMHLLSTRERSNYPLTLSVNDLGEAFSLSALAVASIGAQRVCDYVSLVIEQLVDALENAPQTPINGLSILPARERQQLLQGFNDTRVDYPHGLTIHQRFESQVALYPHALAAVYQGQSLTYAELNRQANQLAHQLIELGVQPDDRVAICARRSLEMLVGLVAILKAGACYVPIDPAHPQERIAYLLQDSAPVVVLAQSSTRELLGDNELPVIELDSDQWHRRPTVNPDVADLTPSNLAYVIYTSGSTGLPKGVMVEHRTLENLVNWHCDAFDLNAGSHTSSVAGFGFDAMAWEVWPTLCSGATLYLPPAQEGNEDIDALLKWWLAQPLDVSFLPTPVAEYAFSQNLQHPTLKTLLIGGDRLRHFTTAQRFTLVNNYGPTEATVVATSGVIEAGQVLHIGKPVANAQVYLLDEHQQPVPQGVAGELYVGGAGVARGYLNRPEMTAERFIKDPFSHAPDARLYRTGDLARWLADGTLDYLGRNDDQVKIRGVRIELGEIETHLSEHAQVREAVVLVRDGRLVAYFTEAQALEIEDLRTWLQAHLPDYMVPTVYVRLDKLPLTANGKVDRKALPEPDQTALLSRGYEAPVGEVETALAQIWADVLKLEQVGRHD
ncbi:amino acid adenylation domain-containing protein, partial [Pseudomonas sp. SDO528_S397]